jgi:hypothetical protein
LGAPKTQKDKNRLKKAGRAFIFYNPVQIGVE